MMFRYFNLILLLAAFGIGLAGARAAGQEAAKPAPVYGKINAITVKGNKAFNANAIIAMSGHKVGDLCDPQALEQMKTSLFNSGNFGFSKGNSPDSVAVTAEQGKDGAITITIEVSENPKIEKINVTGTGPLKAEDIAKLVHKTVVYNAAQFNRDFQDIGDAYNQMGYVATLMPQSGPDAVEPTTLNVVAMVAKVGEIKISGNTSVKTADILAQFETKIGAFYNRRTLRNDLDRLYNENLFKEMIPKERDLGAGKVGLDLAIEEAPLALYLSRKPKSPRVANEKSVARWETKNALILPLEYTATPSISPAVLLRINSSEPLLFVVDTGFSASLVINREVARKLNLTEGHDPIDIGGKEAHSIALKSLAFCLPKTRSGAAQDAPLPLTQAVAAEMPFEPASGYSAPVAGIIGLTLLEHYYDAAQFDFVAKTLTLYTGDYPPLRPAGAAVLPLRWHHGVYTAAVLSEAGTVYELVVDTGSNGDMSFPPNIAEAFQPLPFVGAAHNATLWNGDAPTHSAILPRLKLGSFVEPYIGAEVSETAQEMRAIGAHLLSRYRVTLDFQRDEMLLERAANYKQRVREPGSGEFLVEKQADALRVTLVAPEGGAEKAGVKTGDTVLEINGLPAKNMMVNEAMERMTSAKGEKLKLVLQRPDGKKYAVSYMLSGFFDKPLKSTKPEIGINVSVTPDFRVYVVAIIPDSPAAEAGMRTGDEILESNGEKMTLDYLQAAAKRPPRKVGDVVVMKIQRKGEDKPREFRLVYRLLK